MITVDKLFGFPSKHVHILTCVKGCEITIDE